MADGMKDIIKRLEQQRTAIDRALSALKAIDGSLEGGSVTAAPTAAVPVRKAKRKGGMTPEGRQRLSEALKARWAAKRTPESSAPATKKATKRGRKK